MTEAQLNLQFQGTGRKFAPIGRLGNFCIGCLLLLAAGASVIILLYHFAVKGIRPDFDAPEIVALRLTVMVSTVAVVLSGMVGYVACLFWCFRAFGNLQSFNPRFPAGISLVATFMLAIPYVTLISGFWYLSLLYLRSHPDNRVRRQNAAVIPAFVLLRVGLVNLFWWTIGFPPVAEWVISVLGDLFGKTGDLIFAFLLLTLIFVTAWAAVTYIRKLNDMQMALHQRMENVNFKTCLQCGEVVALHEISCPVCGEEFKRPTNMGELEAGELNE